MRETCPPFPHHVLLVMREQNLQCLQHTAEKRARSHAAVLVGNAISALGDTSEWRGSHVVLIHGWIQEGFSLKVLDVHDVKQWCSKEFSDLISMYLNTGDFQIEHTEKL